MVIGKGIIIKIDDKALDVLVDKGFDPKMGARPLQRVIDKDIKRPLSREMLFGKLKDGGEVTININSDLEFTLEVASVEEAVVETP
jgi:ATP-dependent Clp protease ATP-binding subunit ClpA